MNLENEGKISLLVTFIQRFVTQSKLSLMFTKTLLFTHKTTYFFNNSHDPYKNEDGNSKFYITKLNSWKWTFLKQAVIAEDKIKVILANEYMVKTKNFIIPIFFYEDYFPVKPSISFFILAFFFFKDKGSNEQTTINEINLIY